MTRQEINRNIIRVVIALLVLTVLVALAFPVLARVLAADPVPAIEVTMTNTQPRTVEPATAQAIARAYSTAWSDLARALDHNDVSALSQSFVGYARDRYANQIKDQLKNGMSVHLIAHAHSANAAFYSIDGSALEIHDSVELEKQVLDGGKVIGIETKTVPYVAILTVVEDRWKLRVLQESQQ